MKDEKLFKVNKVVITLSMEDCIDVEVVKASFTLPNGDTVENVEPVKYWGEEFLLYKVSDKVLYHEDAIKVLKESVVLDETLLAKEDIVKGFDKLVRFVDNNDFVVVVKSA